MPETWHHGLVAEWWALFNTDGPEIDYFGRVRRRRPAGARRGLRDRRLLVPWLRAGYDVDGCDALGGHDRAVPRAGGGGGGRSGAVGAGAARAGAGPALPDDRGLRRVRAGQHAGAGRGGAAAACTTRSSRAAGCCSTTSCPACSPVLAVLAARGACAAARAEAAARRPAAGTRLERARAECARAGARSARPDDHHGGPARTSGWAASTSRRSGTRSRVRGTSTTSCWRCCASPASRSRTCTRTTSRGRRTRTAGSSRPMWREGRRGSLRGREAQPVDPIRTVVPASDLPGRAGCGRVADRGVRVHGAAPDRRGRPVADARRRERRRDHRRCARRPGAARAGESTHAAMVRVQDARRTASGRGPGRDDSRWSRRLRVRRAAVPRSATCWVPVDVLGDADGRRPGIVGRDAARRTE